MARLSISLLGPFQVTLDGRPVSSFTTDKARALLAFLTVEADRPHSRDALAGLLWPEQPQRKARQNLRQALSYLRQALDDRDDGDSVVEPFLRVSREAVQFNLESDHWLDVVAFQTSIEAATAHRHRRLETCPFCADDLKKAVEIYRGEFLAHFFVDDSAVFEEWSLLKREWLHRHAVDALFHLANFDERRGDYDQARQYAWRQVALEPWREEAHRQLMRLLALDGQRSASLVQFERCRRALADELGVEPTDETVALFEQIRAGLPLQPSTAVHNLPSSLTPFVGREKELAYLADRLVSPDCRLLTLVGPGGIGKTRLALRSALDQVGSFAHGVYFVPLASVRSSEHIVSAIADALGFSFSGRADIQQQLLDYLREKEMLLVLDNLEHLLDGVPFLASMLRRAPSIVLLATSRERLNLQEEWVCQVEGLAVPEDENADEIEGCHAIELFLQSARRARGDFALSEHETADVVRICQLVEGMPLAIELAAVWVAVRSCREIAREIEHNLDLLTTRLRNVPERHRSIWAAFEYSWELLTEAERGLLRRLSVFRSGFGQEAAVAVAGASPITLLALLDKSLVRRVSTGRYDTHLLLRQYASEKLRTNPEEYQQTHLQHARYFATFLAEQEERLSSVEQKTALGEIALEIENVRQAWRLAVSRREVRQVEQSLESLYQFHRVRCRFQEGVELFAEAIEAWGEEGASMTVLGKTLARQGALYYRLGRYQPARAALEKSLGMFESLGNPSEHIFGLVTLGDVFRSQGIYDKAERVAQESLALSKQTEDPSGVARSLFLLGMVRYRTGDIDQAEELFEASLEIGRDSTNQRLITAALNSLGDVACHRGDFVRARGIFEECLALSRELDDQYNVAIHLNNMGTVVHCLDERSEAQGYYRESLKICREIGDRNGQAVALSNLGEVAFELGNRSHALARFQAGLAIGRDIQDQRTIIACLNNLGQVACALEDYAAAKTYLAEALAITAEIQAIWELLKVLVTLSVLFGKQGQTDRAAALLGMARHHPASSTETQERAQRLLDEMGLVAPAGDPDSLDSMVAEILAEISPTMH